MPVSLVLAFLASAAVTWLAGVTLTKTVDTLDHRLRLGDALGGMILLGISGSLAELTVVASAARDHRPEIVIGILLGGLAIQTLVISIYDLAVRDPRPLSRVAGSRLLALETYSTIALTLLALSGTLLAPTLSLGGVSPASIAIGGCWLLSLWIINRKRKDPAWNAVAQDAAPGRRHHERRATHNHPFYAGKSTAHVIAIFLAASALTLGAGIVLEKTGVGIAAAIGMPAGMFAATFIALVAALPEISAGTESIAIGDNQLAVSDVMGGNSFLLVLFFLADLLAGQPVLAAAQTSDTLMALLGITLMSVYAAGWLLRPRKRYLGLGPDSVLAIIVYMVGMYAIGLVG